MKALITTNTIPLREDKKVEKIVQLSVGNLLGTAIRHVYKDEPVSVLFDMYNK